MEICVMYDHGCCDHVYGISTKCSSNIQRQSWINKNQTGAMYVFAWMLESSFVCMLTLGMVKGAETVTQKALGV